MDIRRFFVPKDNIKDDLAIIDGEEYVHVTKVMRYKVGYKLILSNGDGYDYHAVISSIDNKKVVCKIEEAVFNERELNTKISLYLGIIKSEKLDFALQKAVELGVREITPVISEYTSEKSFKEDRALRIIVEACKQCGRAIVPTLNRPVTFEQAIKSAKGDILLAYEKETDVKARDLFSSLSQEVSLFIGSEGGYSQKEIELAKSLNAKTFTLGKRILRTETAVISAISAIAIFTEE